MPSLFIIANPHPLTVFTAHQCPGGIDIVSDFSQALTPILCFTNIIKITPVQNWLT